MIDKEFIKSDNHLIFIRRLTFVWLVVILILSFISSDELPKADGIPHVDKIVHVIMYSVLSFLSLLSYNETGKTNRIMIILAGIFGIGLFIELMQAILPFGRTFSVFDLGANLTGIFTGLATYLKSKKIPYFNFN